MDPFVVISLGRKTYRTRVIRHNLNPVFDEKLVFQVARNEINYSICFSVVDRDNFSGNDYVGKVDLPLENVLALAPEPNSSTGLFALPDGMITPTPEAKKSRFRLPLSRSASSQSLSKQAKLPSRENSLLPPGEEPVTPAAAPTSNPFGVTGVSSIPTIDQADEGFKPFVLPLELKNKQKWVSKNSKLYLRAKYMPYLALRQQFWRAMLRQYDADESGRIDKVELTTMLDSLGSTLHESTIEGFFERYPHPAPGELPSLSFDEAVMCLEDQLTKTSAKTRPLLAHTISALNYFGGGDESGTATGTATGTTTPSLSASMAGFSLSPDAPQTGDTQPALEPLAALESNGLSDDQGEEHVVEIRECPICHQPRLNKRSDSDIVTHIATCASQDWRKVNNIVMGGFVTANQAQRKWYSKVMTKISYGGYRLGANSANILVQDRITGQINEEKMSVYVRLGIRLLYKGLKANNMEMKRSMLMILSNSY
jgi:phosphatidylserine decarboxylase